MAAILFTNQLFHCIAFCFRVPCAPLFGVGTRVRGTGTPPTEGRRPPTGGGTLVVSAPGNASGCGIAAAARADGGMR